MVIDIVKRDHQTSTNIQALMSNRAIARKKHILDYIDKHRICTKYDITKEIRNYEAQMELKGSIDAKTTKRMLYNLEKENKLRLFEVNLKNLNYMCVRAWDVSENDPLYINYCSTFRRTFDSVDSKFKTELDRSDTSPSTSSVSTPTTSKILVPRSATGFLTPCEATTSSTIEKTSKAKTSKESSPTKVNDHAKDLDLTRPFIKSVVDKLKVSTRFSKTYALVPKIQKLIVLHRFLTHVLYFNQKNTNESCSNTGKHILNRF